MTHEEQRLYLIEALLAEDARYRNLRVPPDEQGRKDLLRSLMNVRPPRPVGAAFLEVQDAYLTAERDRTGIVEADTLSPIVADKRIVLWQGDMTVLQVDAIVNAANSALLGCFHPLHSCIDNMVHSKSGVQLRLYCHDLMQRQGHAEAAGQAKMTPAFNLPSRYVLHTVGPIVDGPATTRDGELLSSCYRSCLALAAANGCKSVAFCCISTGEFHFPNRMAAKIAVDTVRDFLKTDQKIERVVFNVYKDLDLTIYQDILGVCERDL